MNDNTRINDEESLILGLCRLEFSDEYIDKIRALMGLVKDWNYFKNLTNAHGVSALIFHNIERLNLLINPPDEVVTFLRNALMLSLSRNTYNTGILAECLSLLNKENIKTVLLKGIALENSVFGNSGLRQMTDVDILINRNECIKAREILLKQGFVSLPVKSIFHEIIIADTGKHLPSLIKNGTSIEIHHELFGGRENALTRQLYESSYLTEINGEKAYIPQPQVFFLYLVRHLNFHEMKNESQLRLYTDLVVLIEKYYDKILNNDLVTLASQAGMTEVLASHLGLLRDFWGIEFEALINEFIDSWYNEDSSGKFIFFLKSPKGNPHVNKQRFYRNLVSEVPGIHRKFLFLLGDIFPSIKFMKKRYKSDSTFRILFYYPHRLGKFLWLFRR